MTYIIKEVTMYEVVNAQTGERYTLVETPEDAETQRLEAQKNENDRSN